MWVLLPGIILQQVKRRHSKLPQVLFALFLIGLIYFFCALAVAIKALEEGYARCEGSVSCEGWLPDYSDGRPYSTRRPTSSTGR